MSLYNLTFFNRAHGTLLYNVSTYEAEISELDYDYLTPETTSFTMRIREGDPLFSYIRQGSFVLISSIDDPHNNYLENDPDEGHLTLRRMDGMTYIVENIVSDDKKRFANIEIKQAITLFEQPVLYNTVWQANDVTPLEATIFQVITDHWVFGGPNIDAAQTLPIVFHQPTSTFRFNLDLEPDRECEDFCICDFYDAVLREALLKYQIVVSPCLCQSPYGTPVLGVVIENRTNVISYIEADQPNVIVENFEIDKLGESVNALEIWNEDGYQEKKLYLLYNDGTYGEFDPNVDVSAKRILPVVKEVIGIDMSQDEPEPDPEEGEGEDPQPSNDEEEEEPKTFAEQCEEQADSKFKDAVWATNVQLTIVYPESYIYSDRRDPGIGNTCYITHLGKTYKTICTAKKLTAAGVSYTFGSERITLTKQKQNEERSKNAKWKNKKRKTSDSEHRSEY